MTEKTNYEKDQAKYYLDLVEGVPSMELAAIYTQKASAHATLAVADELRQLRELVDGVVVVHSDGSPHFIRVRE